MRLLSLLMIVLGTTGTAAGESDWKPLTPLQPAASLPSQLPEEPPSPSSTGMVGAGVLRVHGAQLGKVGSVRLSVTGDYFRQNHFPVINALNSRTTGVVGMSYVFAPSWEAYFSYQATVNQNTKTRPTMIQSLGDISLGLKWATDWGKGLHTGLDISGQYFSGIGMADLQNAAYGVFPRAIVTWDTRAQHKPFPLRVHANTGWALDTTSRLSSNTPLTASAEFALGIQKYSRWTASAAIDVPLRFVTPFVEYELAYPLGVASGQLTGPDGAPVSVFRSMPQTLTGGIKITPFAPLSVVAAVDVGLSQRVALGVPATPPWKFVLGASVMLERPSSTQAKADIPTPKAPVATVAPLAAPPSSSLTGFVVDLKNRAPIAGAVVSIEGQNVPPVATDATGRFVTHPIPFGTLKLTTSKEGYAPHRQWFNFSSSKTGPLQIVLEETPRWANLNVTVFSQRKPIAAQVAFLGQDAVSLKVPARSGGARILLAPGTYTVEIVAEGCLSQTQSVQANENTANNLSFDLTPAPSNRSVAVTPQKIELLKPIAFVGNTAELHSDSRHVLLQVVDAIVRHKIAKLRVEAHTANQGGKANNLALSKDRALAVVNYLVELGIKRARLESRGMGQEKPVAPNFTPKGRALNRRVELFIVPTGP